MDKNLYIDKEKENNKIASVMLFGAGTQSIGLLLLMLDGKFKLSDKVVFADVGDEPKHVYDYFDMFQNYIKSKFDFEISIVKRNDKSLSKTIFDYIDGISDEKPKSIPYRTENGLLRYRQCTDHYKIRPIRKYIKQLYNRSKTRTIEMIFGISLDEMQRMKNSPLKYEYNRYPLIEMELKRIDVIKYVKKHGLPEPPRSSCLFCPFHSNDYWNFLKTEHPEDFEKAVYFDEKIRNFPGFKSKLYINKNDKTPKPLKEFRYVKHPSLFSELIDECEGHCGI